MTHLNPLNQSNNSPSDPKPLATVNYSPRIISWNTTKKCNLKCQHCYINAKTEEDNDEMNTVEGKALIDQIADLGKSILVLSGGEPLLRKDIFELARYAVQKGLVVALGTNGTLLDNQAAKSFHEVGLRRVAISIDSSTPQVHDELRGVEGSWSKAIDGVNASLRNGLDVQFNVTMTRQNLDDFEGILSMAERMGVKNVHLFFLVPTGRGKNVRDISPLDYEALLRKALAYPSNKLQVKPTCAPQFMRIAKEMKIDMRRWGRGCIAGISYCRVMPDGSVTPCPYVPVKVGNVRDMALKEIWNSSEVLNALRDFSKLKGKCGFCSYRDVCGGCRARAYGLTSYCSGASISGQERKIEGDILAEDPWCTYNPNPENQLSERKIIQKRMKLPSEGLLTVTSCLRQTRNIALPLYGLALVPPCFGCNPLCVWNCRKSAAAPRRCLGRVFCLTST